MPPKTKPKASNQKSKFISETDKQQPPPNWPPLKPLIPPSDLWLETVLPDQIYVIRNFLTSTLCKNYVSFLSTLPLVTTPGRPKKGEAVRVNDRFQIDDSAFAERLWKETALDQVLLGAVGAEKEDLWGGNVVGLNPNIRVYRYTKGQFFGQHCGYLCVLLVFLGGIRMLKSRFNADDDSVTVRLPSSEGQAMQGKTTWTLLIYLTTCTGGETVFYPEPVISSKTNGPKSKASKDNNAHMDPIVAELEVVQVFNESSSNLNSDLIPCYRALDGHFFSAQANGNGKGDIQRGEELASSCQAHGEEHAFADKLVGDGHRVGRYEFRITSLTQSPPAC
ncbi:conserved hypothetical protein [Uncinocarpus reesii 1704]|uniref:Prolyl 4-hydroxylase alpha subunit domain-containing protein n=1 Tax=Uncinocarpus reesii (strain UAMH 1704) TaxID=336963 RepID=C4JK32_UNCRE|nr:uncharacterized protein UREG_01989 [Uncinocarpus reesii 1704]EEP77140.1 conserved hypothetical protein [Uncinocarpus reesii 1704]